MKKILEKIFIYPPNIWALYLILSVISFLAIPLISKKFSNQLIHSNIYGSISFLFLYAFIPLGIIFIGLFVLSVYKQGLITRRRKSFLQARSDELLTENAIESDPEFTQISKVDHKKIDKQITSLVIGFIGSLVFSYLLIYLVLSLYSENMGGLFEIISNTSSNDFWTALSVYGLATLLIVIISFATNKIRSFSLSNIVLWLFMLIYAKNYLVIYDHIPPTYRDYFPTFSDSPSQKKLSNNMTQASTKQLGQNTIELKQINNVGYSFYIGQIDYKDTKPLDDELLNNITQVLADSLIPKKLLKDVAIVVVNTLAIDPNDNINTPYGLVNLPTFDPLFLSGGGIYSQSFNSMSIIYLNSRKVTSDSTQSNSGNMNDLIKLFEKDQIELFLKSTLTHELAHHIGSKLKNEEWQEFYKLRNIPENTPRRSSNWQISPTEDFAEVYTNYITQNEVRTYYGTLLKRYEFDKDPCDGEVNRLVSEYEAVNPKPAFENAADWPSAIFAYNNMLDQYKSSIQSNTEIQECRRNVLLNLENYPDLKNQIEGNRSPYKHEVNQATKDFIRRILTNLN